MENLDDIDKKILSMLMRNSRTPYKDIAKEIGYTDVAVIRRIKKLEESGVIKKYTIEVDPSKIGFNKVSITGINVKPDALLHVVDELKKRRYVKYIAITSGDHEIITIIWAKDHDELDNIHRELKEIEGVEKTYPAIIVDVVKSYEDI